MSKEKFGILSPQPYFKKAIEEMQETMEIVTVQPKGWAPEEVAETVKFCKDNGIKSVGGFAQKDAFNHILINRGLGHKAPDNLAFLYCMNKYLMRTLETDAKYFDWVDPLTETNEEIIAKIKEWPFMLKNTSLSLGRGIFKIETPEELTRVLDEYRGDKPLQEEIAYNIENFSKGIDPKDLPKVIPPFIAEHLVDMMQAVEYCYEGFVDSSGNLVHYALTEEVYFPNHQALGYVTPTISIDHTMADKIDAWITDYMSKLIDLGYVNQFFNIEFWIFPDGRITLTEINPRAAHNYHYNYKFCSNNSLFSDNFHLAADEKVSSDTPWQKWRNNESFNYTLEVLLTAKEMGKTSDIIDYSYIKSLEEKGNIVRYVRKTTDVLTQDDMTSAGVMLLQIWVTGATKQDVIKQEKEVRKNAYRKPQVVDYPKYFSDMAED